MSFEFIELSTPARYVTQITINRPDALNALNPQVLRELKQAATDLAGQDDLGAVIITGAGRAFVAGADIKSMTTMSPEAAQTFAHEGHDAMSSIANLPVPVIAAINGFALGGGLELAISCDLLYASTKAKLGLPEVGLGLIPGFGGTQRLGRLIGYHAAREMIYTGKMIGADRARALGLVLAVVEPDELMHHVLDVAKSICKQGPQAVRAAKRSLELGRDVSLEQGLDKEQSLFQGLFHNEEPREGMSAHLEKRKPVWRG